MKMNWENWDNWQEAPIVYDDSRPEPRSDGRLIAPNSHLDKLESDSLYHLALEYRKDDNILKKKFNHIKFVCMGGTVKRMKEFAKLVAKRLDIDIGDEPEDITQASGRYSMFMVGPVLSISHGMGGPSFSILLHEIFKLVMYAECKHVTFFRIGTSGGIGVPPGTVAITNQAVDELIRPFHEVHINGQIVRRPSTINRELIEELQAIANKEQQPYATLVGATMCANDFYEAQSRLDGAMCNFNLEQKMIRLQQLHEAGVINIEMEATVFASMCLKANVPGAIVCVTLVNRLEGDQINESKEYYEELQRRPQEFVLKFIESRLASQTNGVNDHV